MIASVSPALTAAIWSAMTAVGTVGIVLGSPVSWWLGWPSRYRFGDALRGESRAIFRFDPPLRGDSILQGMNASLAIGDFARATHLSIKTLRYYHRVGVLEPADVDADTGYRRYGTEQIPVAQVIRRFRDLDMPLEDIQSVLNAPDLAARNRVIASHLGRLEATLERTQHATASLRDLLEAPAPATPADLAHVSVAATTAAAISDTIDIEDAGAWYQGALGELHASLAAQDIVIAGPAGGIYSNDLFTEDRGEATVFIPCDLTFPPPSCPPPPTPDPTPTLTAPTARWPPTSPSTPSASTDQSASTTSPTATPPPTSQNGAPRSAGRSSPPPAPA